MYFQAKNTLKNNNYHTLEYQTPCRDPDVTLAFEFLFQKFGNTNETTDLMLSVSLGTQVQPQLRLHSQTALKQKERIVEEVRTTT
jgi:hypothetical protein